jgi:hypothetical protein
MAKFKINDEIKFVRKSKDGYIEYEILKKGIVTKGPFKVDGVDHYNVKWNWTDDGIQWKNILNEEIIADLSSTKYEYRNL